MSLKLMINPLTPQINGLSLDHIYFKTFVANTSRSFLVCWPGLHDGVWVGQYASQEQVGGKKCQVL